MKLDPFYWLAGILEGEGTFMGGPPSYPNSPIARICMTDRDTVTRAALLLDRAVTPVRAQKPHYKPPFVTQINGVEAVALMSAMRPVERRRAAIDLALASYRPIFLMDPPSSCVVPDCDQPHRARGLCHKHYMIWSRDRAKRRETWIAPLR